LTLFSRASLLALSLSLLVPQSRGDSPQRPDLPGPSGQGVTLLPNGWRIAPVGRHIDVGDLPLAMALHPDGRHLVVTNNGYSKPSLRVIDLERWEVTQKLPLDDAWLGLVWHPDGKRLFSSSAAHNSIQEVEWRGGRLVPGRTLVLAPPQKDKDGGFENPGFVAGLAISPDGRTLYAAHVFGESLAAVDVESGKVVAQAKLPAEAYATLVSPDGRTVLVSVWGASRVALFEPVTLRPLAEIAVGEHPNAMALSRDGTRLFVACANTNAVWAVDLASRKAVEQIGVALRPDAPPGVTPNALALAPEGDTLLVANADNNAVAVVDVREPGESRPLGFIPTGWYPTAAAFDASGRNVLVLSGKGLTPVPNPRGPQPVSVQADAQYIAGLLKGSLTVLPRPDESTLQHLTERVYSVTAGSSGGRRGPAGRPEGSPIPGAGGQASPIKYVFYVIRENRTYDQVLGDVTQGNGDPNLTLFGQDVTPNAHALASEFVLFDNFYVDSEVSHDGHSYSTAAYATDSNEKLWPTQYADRGGLYMAEGGYRMRNPYGNLTAPAQGYIWDFAGRAGVPVRSYGEFAEWDRKGGPVRASVPGLEGKVHPSFPPFDLSIPDNERVDVWLEEFRRFEKDGGLPRLNIFHLGGDHTNATAPGSRTPTAMVAENDAALGRMVELISKSRFWPESAVFVLEDDAQNGPDHVDAHRSVLLVASPWARHGAVDSTLYTTSGVLRTMELVLGLPPMSQYDAAATPLYAAFTPKPDPAPYTALPPKVDIHEKNRDDAPGAQASLEMDLTRPDAAPDLELNEVVWKSVRGASAVMPPPIRAAFVRPISDGDEDENDE
jgi:DNA-binding beta-propeller fold protein YncE